ncbi:hypothetical protein CFC21_106970 [Triticum aestivum]|uniref:AAA ATPase AAA+ lid domain-containing protein n=3 Tax=Triticinae TaxID=1648030 RepID=A0A453QIG5_AEGTS|nr:hypothetical protein CFC21_106970 [Triticum aestivum]
MFSDYDLERLAAETEGKFHLPFYAHSEMMALLWSLMRKHIYMSLGYSGSDLRALCEEATMMSISELGAQNILSTKANQVLLLQFLNFVYRTANPAV